jgi:glucose/arabinose dehydrogenase
MTTRIARLAAAGTALLLLAAGCSHKPDTSADRIISSPGATGFASSSVETPGASPTTAATTSPSSKPPVANVAGTPTATSRPALGKARIKLTRIASLNEPLAMAFRKGDPDLYIAEKGGKIRIYHEGGITGTALDISSQVSTGSEQGLLGLAFSPGGTKLYVYFTDKNGSGPAGDDVVREYPFSSGHVTSSGRDVLRVSDPETNHNGGNLIFGPDGYLYIGLGDGGGGGDAHGSIGNGQNINVLLGKLLRIDPTRSGSAQYKIPSDNPFVGRDGRDEIWAYGLRNPWRWSFDRQTHDLWIGDVGQNAWEEIDFQPASSHGGENYGWRRREGDHPYNGGTKPPGAIDPIYEYSHDGGNCSITGGYVYRGSRIHNLVGAYLFADFCVGRLRAFVRNGGSAAGHRFLGPQVANLSSFGQDRNGELYVLSLDGGVYKINPA